MEIIEINNKQYIIGEKIFEYAPLFCKGSRNPRELVKTKGLNPPEFVCARKDKNGGWIQSDGKSRRLDKVLFLESLVREIPEVQKYMSLEGKVENKEEEEESKRFEKYNIDPLPPIIILEDDEKFKDDSGNIYDIETRGERQVDKIYFSVEDVSKCFELENLYTLIRDERKTYKLNEHYKIFICKKPAILAISSKVSTNKIQKKVYLTYEGILKVLFSSRSPKVKKFVKWATETLFTIQMGSIEKKQEMVSNVLGIDPKVLREVLKSSANSLPCVYLISLGSVGNLRKKLNIDKKICDNHIVCKYGYTDNLSRRMIEHNSVFHKLGIDIKIKYYSYIDPQFLSKAEKKLKNFYEALNVKLEYDNFSELVVIPDNLIEKNIIREQYEQLSKSYAGHYTELIQKINDLENELEKQQLKHQIELEKYKNDCAIRDKDIEILNYKIKFLELEKKMNGMA